MHLRSRSKCSRLVEAVVFTSLLGLGTIVRAEEPTTAPSAPATLNSLTLDMQSANKELAHLLNKSVLGDAKRRQAIAPQAIPVLKRIQSDFDGIDAIQPGMSRSTASGRLQTLSLLSALGDPSSDDSLKTMVGSKDLQQSLRAQGAQLMARWYQAGADPSSEASVVDAVDQLDHAHPDDNMLTMFTMSLSRMAATQQLRDRLQTLATEGMTSPAAVDLKKKLDASAQSEATESKLLNQPLTVTGTQADGTAFSTTGWKGKVVLVDFWATWCGPCKAELPRVKQIYQRYHAQGLELVGVSNDYDRAKLTTYVHDQQMPWPELFDAGAAANQQWNAVTESIGVDRLPTMFLIDKKGVARSVTATEDMDTLIPKLLAEAGE